MKARLSPAQFAENWAKATAAAGEKYKQGIQRVQGNPAQAAIAAKELCRTRFNEAMDSGKWERGLQKVTEAGWKQACIDKGATALVNSVRLATDKVARAEAEMGNIREQIVNSLPPRGDIMQNLERQRLMALGLHEARKRG